MGEILLGAKAQLKLDIICKIIVGQITRLRGCEVLEVSQRTLERYVSRYRRVGPVFIKHGNCARVPSNKTPDSLRLAVQDLVRTKYHDFNMTHLREKLSEAEKIEVKRETLRKWCHEIHHVKRKKRRPVKARYYRDRMRSTGLMVQLDGSSHRWFGNKESTLIASIDDADSDIPYAEFFPAEDTISCMTVLQKIVERKGIFSLLYVDRAGVFGGHKRMDFSQVKRALLELGIQTIYATSAEGKGRVERLFQTLQDRLIPEMRLRRIKTYPAANQYLQKEYLPKEWRAKFTIKPRCGKTAYSRLSNRIELKEIFCLKHYRGVQKNHTITLDSKIYSLTSPTRFSIYRQQIEIRTYQDLTWRAFYAGKPIDLTLVDQIERGLSVWQSMRKVG